MMPVNWLLTSLLLSPESGHVWLRICVAGMEEHGFFSNVAHT
jgi:hypothetical protein